MKKRLVFFSFIILFGFSYFAHAQFEGTGLEDAQNGSLVGGVQKIQQTVEERRWEYLSQQWKELLLKNRFISAFDSWLKKGDILFVILLGQHYSLSIQLFFVFILWVFFIIAFYKIFSGYAPYSQNVAVIIAIAFGVVIAQFKLLEFLSGKIVTAVFIGGMGWRWISFVIFILVLLFFIVLISLIAKKGKEEKKKKAEKKQEQDQETVGEFAKGILKGSEKAN